MAISGSFHISILCPSHFLNVVKPQLHTVFTITMVAEVVFITYKNDLSIGNDHWDFVLTNNTSIITITIAKVQSTVSTSVIPRDTESMAST